MGRLFRCWTDGLNLSRFCLFAGVILMTGAPSGADDKAEPSRTGVQAAPLNEGGVLFTFDDRNFDDWVSAIPLLDQYGIKATFFISGNQLNCNYPMLLL